MSISHLTPEQVARFPEWKAKWIEIGLSTVPADFEAAEEAALKAYALYGLRRPQVVLRVGSPYSATLGGVFAHQILRALVKPVQSQVKLQIRQQVWEQVQSQVGEQVRSQVWEQVWEQINQQVQSQVWSQAWVQIWEQARSQTCDQIWEQVRSQTWSQVREQIGRQVQLQVRQQVWEQIEVEIWEQVWKQVGAEINNDLGGSLFSSWGAYISFFRDVCDWNSPVLKRFAIDEALMKSCGWVWWREDVLAISDRPRELHRDAQGRLHCETGPSIAYRDGWALYHWHGVAVPADVIERPREITIPKIKSEKNSEVRRIMIERYGVGKFVLDSDAKLIHQDSYGKLYRQELTGDEPLVMVQVLNPTPEANGTLSEAEARATFGDDIVNANLSVMARIGFISSAEQPRFKAYFLRVPPDTKTAHAAVAWTFGLQPEQYTPRMET